MNKISFVTSVALCCWFWSASLVPAFGQLFSKSKDSQVESGDRPFQIFGGRGLSDNQLKSDEQPRLFGGWGMRDSDPASNRVGQNFSNGIFGGRGMAEIPFDDGSGFSSDSNWNDFDSSDSQRWPFRRFNRAGNQSEMRSARRLELDDRPRLFGNRPTLFENDPSEPTWFERMNQRSRDFWSESTDRMQERNQAMRARRQETWDSITRGLRPNEGRSDFDLPPFEDDAISPSRNQSAIDRF